MIGLPADSLIFDALEMERDRIARELHDGVGQLVTAARLLAEANPDNAQLVASLLADASSELSRICKSLDKGDASPLHVRPLHAGLGLALSELANRTSVLPGVACMFACSRMISDRDQTALHVYRVAQEAVNNAVRHGRATELSLVLRVQDDALVLTVTDNGRWVAADDAVEHHGLANMATRAADAGGTLDIRPGDDEAGTSVTLTLPRHSADSHAQFPSGGDGQEGGVHEIRLL